jgi:transposase
VSRESEARSQPHGLHHRQPEREKRRKRGARIDPHGGACPRARLRRDPGDAGKLIKGKKRHVLVDTQGLLLHGLVTAADVQDRDGGLALLTTLFGLFPFLGKLFADSAYGGPIFHGALAGILPCLEIEIVKRSDKVKGFIALPRRWIVERTIAWLNRCRRLAKDWENLNRNALAFLKLASIRLMLRKLCNPL